MNNLKCRKQGFNKYVCKRTNKEIKLCDCSNCPYKEYKECTKIVQKRITDNKECTKNQKYCTKIKKRSSNLAKLEKERFSLFTDNKDRCMFCGSTYKLTWHEIYCGRNRRNSMRYGLCLRMCLRCHKLKQENKQFNDEWHKKGQAMFSKAYPNEDFNAVFRKNYK